MKPKSEIQIGDKLVVVKSTTDQVFFTSEVLTCVKIDEQSMHLYASKTGDSWRMSLEEWDCLEEKPSLDRNELAREFLNSMLKGPQSANAAQEVNYAFQLADQFIKQANK